MIDPARYRAKAVELGFIDATRAAGCDDLLTAGLVTPDQDAIVRASLDDAQATWRSEGTLLVFEPGTPVAATLGPRSPAAHDRSEAPTGGREPKYSIGRALGRGGMGEVRLAVDRDLRRQVAIKTLLAPHLDVARLRFVEEAQITGQLEHPNIVPVHELGLDADGRPFLVMKRVKGRSLDEVLQDVDRGRDLGQATPGRVLARLLEIFAKICDAVAYAHSRGVVHRDLKPANVMVGEFGEVLVMDWGLAKVIGASADREPVSTGRDDDPDARASLTGAVSGTPAYMSPEQARGETRSIDARSDIYSLGSVLYEMLALRRAFDGSSAAGVMALVARGTFQPPSARSVAPWPIPRELEAVVLTAMATDAADRYPSVVDLRSDIEAFLAGQTLVAARYSPWERAAKWVRRNRTAVAGVAATLLVALLGLRAALWTADRARRDQIARETAERESLLEERAGELAALEAELQALDAASQAGRHREAVEGLGRFATDRRQEIDRLAHHELLRSERPEVAAAAGQLAATGAELRRQAIVRWARQTVPAGGDDDPSRTTDIEAAYERFRAYQLAEPQLADLPVAELALWLAERASADQDPAAAARWVANAYIAGPATEAAGRAFKLLADRSLAEGQRERAASQYHRALSAFGRRHPSLRPPILLGLARALASMHRRTAAPFSSDVAAGRMALRTVLQLVRPDGSLRPEIADVLDGPTADRIATEAGDWLFFLRRTTIGTRAGWGHPVDLDGDGVLDSATMGGGPFESRLVRPGPPAEALGPPTIEEIAAFDLREAFARTYPEETDDDIDLSGPWPVRLLAGQDAPQYVFSLFNRARKVFHIVAVAGPDADRFLFHVDQDRAATQLHAGAVSAGDVDDDGRTDLVVGFPNNTRRVMVLYQIEPGRFRFEPLSAVDRGSRSDVYNTFVDDFDGDGRNEVVVFRGPWNDFALEAYRARPGGESRPIARAVIGNAHGILRVPTPEGPGLAAAPWISPELAPAFRSDRGVVPLDVAVWRLVGDRFVASDGARVERRHDLSGPTHFESFLSGYQIGRDRWALLESIVHHDQIERSTSGSLACSIWQGRGPEATGPRTLELPSSSANRACLPGHVFIDNEIGRRLTDDELSLLAAEPIPLADPDEEGGHAGLTIARALVEIGLAGQALAFVDARSEDGDLPSVVAGELARIRIQCLLRLGRADDLAAALERIEVDESLAADVLLAAETLAVEHLRFAAAADLLARWSRAQVLPGSYRTLVRRRQAEWRQMARTLDVPALDWRAMVVERPDAPPASLADLLLANHPHLIGPPDPARPGDLPILLAEARTSIARPRPGGAVLDRLLPAAGIPVRFGGGSWRMVIDFRVDGMPWQSRGHLGLIEAGRLVAPTGKPDRGPAIQLTVDGGNHVLEFDLLVGGSSILADRLIGHRLRIAITYLETSGVLRIQLADRDEGRLLLDERSHRKALDAGIYLVGLSGTQRENRAEGALERVWLAGEFTVLAPDAAEVVELLGPSPEVADLSAAARATLSGDGPARAAALERIADRWAAAGLERETASGWGPDLAGLERARALSGRSAADLAANLGDLDAGPAEALLLTWLLTYPTLDPPPGLWEGAGRLAAARFAPGVEPADLPGRLHEAMSDGRIPAGPGLVAATGCALERPGDRSAATIAAWATLSAVQSGLSGGRSVLGLRPLAVGRTLPEADETAPLRSLVGVWEAHFMHRTRGLARLAASGRPSPLPGFVEGQTRLDDLRQRHLDWLAGRVADRSLPAVPGE